MPEPRDVRLRELSSGIDALYMSGHGTVSPGLLKLLENARREAEERSDVVPLALGDGGWVIEPRRFLLYRYSLVHEHGRMGVSDRESLPALRLQPLSEFIHAVGAADAVAWFRGQAEEAVAGVRLTGARLDLYADWQGWQLSASDLPCFVRRAKYSNTRASGEDWTGFDFGLRKSKTVLGRLYDKTREVDAEGKDWWYEIWAERFERALPVLRTELEVGRIGLREHGIEAAADMVERAPELWAALTSSWLTHRTPSGDETRARWPVSPQWQQVQHASFAHGAIGLERVRQGKNTGSLRTLMPALVGYLASAGAHLGSDSLEDTMELLVEHVWRYGDLRGHAFEDRIREKRCDRGAA